MAEALDLRPLSPSNRTPAALRQVTSHRCRYRPNKRVLLIESVLGVDFYVVF